MNTENVITLWNGLKKEDYLRLLKEKTYQYNLTNTYMANSFLSKIQEDQIFIYYTGRNSAVPQSGFKGFDATLKEDENGVILEGKFVPAGHIKFFYFFFITIMWIMLLWFAIPAPYTGIVVLVLGVIINVILHAIITKTDMIDSEELILDFLVNLHMK